MLPTPDEIKLLSADPRVQEIAEALRDAELYLVGGCLRDAVLGRGLRDVDLSVSLRPEEMIARFDAAGLRVIPTGLQHQTVTVVTTQSAEAVEVTSFRTKGISSSNPCSFGQSIEEDLRYRDFTMNALAVRYTEARLIDPHGGLEDLQRRVVRAVGDAVERFVEDPLRILRMVRFAVQLSFTIDDSTMRAAAAQSSSVSAVAVERVRDEFTKILLSDDPARGMRLLHECGALQQFLPEIAEMHGFEQNSFHHLDLFEHTLSVLEKTSPILELRLAALFHDVGKIPTLSIDELGERHFYKHEQVGAEQTVDLLRRLRYPAKVVSQVSTLVQTHMRPLTAGAGGIRRILRDVEDLFPLWRELKVCDAEACLFAPEQLRAQLDYFDREVEAIRSTPDVSPLKNLALSGHDIVGLGVAPGPTVGVVLRALHEQVLDQPELNTREELLSRAAQMLRDPVAAAEAEGEHADTSAEPKPKQ